MSLMNFHGFCICRASLNPDFHQSAMLISIAKCDRDVNKPFRYQTKAFLGNSFLGHPICLNEKRHTEEPVLHDE